MLTENSNISCLHPCLLRTKRTNKKLLFCSLFPSLKLDILYILREKDIYENHKDVASIRVGWIHPANLSTSKNTKVYFLLTLLIYLWFAETQSEKSAFSLDFAGQSQRQTWNFKAGVGKHILWKGLIVNSFDFSGHRVSCYNDSSLLLQCRIRVYNSLQCINK